MSPELVMALLIVFSMAAAYIALDSVIPLPKAGSRLLISGVRSEVRDDMIRGFAYVPLLLGTCWLFKSVNSRRRSARLFFAVVEVLAAIHVVEALLILGLSPGALTGSSAKFRWASVEAYSAAQLSTWATVVTLSVAWILWRRKSVRQKNAAA